MSLWKKICNSLLKIDRENDEFYGLVKKDVMMRVAMLIKYLT